MIFSRTDLRISQSRAKHHEESDFEVRFGVAPQKPYQKCEKLIFRSKQIAQKIFSRGGVRRREKYFRVAGFGGGENYFRVAECGGVEKYIR